MIEFVILASEALQRLDRVVSQRLGISVNEARRIIDRGLVRVDGKRMAKSAHVGKSATLRVDVEPSREGDRVVAQPYAPEPEDGELDVLHADDAVIVVDKPAGLPTHPLKPGERGTLANRLAKQHPECVLASTDPRDGGFAHRLDLATTGVVIAARTRPAYEALRATFTNHDADKIYWALVHGIVTDTVIDKPLETRRKKAVVSATGLAAKTGVRVIATGNHYSFVEARTSTGRLHQIRAHLADAGHPLAGDTLYGAAAMSHVDGAQLHARAITLPHPTDRWLVTWAAPLSKSRRLVAEHLLGVSLADLLTR